jgi:hypothetical protein
VQALLQGLILTGGNCFKSFSIFFAKWLLFLVKNPLKSFLFIVKFYISLLLLGFFLTASFSTLAHEVSAKEDGSPTIISPIMSPDIRGQPWSTVKSAIEASFRAGNMSGVSCSTVSSTPTYKLFDCNMINGYSGLPRQVTLGANASGPLTYSCPPLGYNDHTVLTDDTCNTPSGDHGDEPEPEPEPNFPTINCTALAGNGADFASFYSSQPLTQEELTTSKCSNNVGGNSKSDNSCHIVNGAGWTGQPVYDDAGIETGINYTSINGTFSGFACDASGNASAPNTTCTAIDNGRMKSVECPDGTSMTVNWGDFLDTKEAFLNQRSSVQDDLNAVNNRVDSVLNSVPTTDDIVVSLASNQAFKDSVKGQDGEPCTVARLQSNNGIFMNCNGSQTNIFDGSNGSNGATGESGENGEDGESCTAIATTDGVNIVCKETTQFLASGKTGLDGVSGGDGKDGDNCSVVDNGTGATITCGASTVAVDGVDEGGIVTAIGQQTTTLMTGLTYEGDLPSVGFSNSEGLTAALGTANDYEVRNYGTVIESAVNEMKESPVFVAVDGFFEVSFSGSCPTYTANVDFMNTSVTMDHWCRPIMNEIWPIIQAIIMFGFSFMAFRVAIL